MNEHGITRENLLRSLPVSLSGDPKMVALADAISGVLAERREEIRRVAIYPRIGRLDEGLLDILARDFKVDWWDYDYSLDEKRRTLASSWKVHKTLGTRAAVETALRAIYPHSDAEPWFLYEGRPYHFRLKIDLTDEKYLEGKPERALRQIQYYKSLRDHLDSIIYTIALPPSTLRIGGGFGGHTTFGLPPGPDDHDYRHTLHTGITAGTWSALGLPEDSCLPDSTDSIRMGGTYSRRTALPVPEDRKPPPAPTILRTGGVCTILSNLIQGE